MAVKTSPPEVVVPVVMPDVTVVDPVPFGERVMPELAAPVDRVKVGAVPAVVIVVAPTDETP